LPGVGGPMPQAGAPYFDERAVAQIRASLPTGHRSVAARVATKGFESLELQ
jgi:hypothetical protein